MRKASVSGSLYRLIYCSKNTLASLAHFRAEAADMQAEIVDILAKARQRNRAEGVTGALLFTASGFAQVLEGPREIIERTFERISADPRHTDVTVLSFTPTEKRSFPDWSMAFCGQTPDDAADPLACLLPDAAGSGPRMITGSDVLRLLARVVHREDQWTAA